MIILPEQNYDQENTIVGERFRGDGYYGRTDGLHTVAYYLNDFVGEVKIQATLVLEPSESDWFTVDNTAVGDGSTVLTENTYRNFTGNFVWIRVSVENFTAGNIKKVTYSN